MEMVVLRLSKDRVSRRRRDGLYELLSSGQVRSESRNCHWNCWFKGQWMDPWRRKRWWLGFKIGSLRTSFARWSKCFYLENVPEQCYSLSRFQYGVWKRLFWYPQTQWQTMGLWNSFRELINSIFHLSPLGLFKNFIKDSCKSIIGMTFQCSDVAKQQLVNMQMHW